MRQYGFGQGKWVFIDWMGVEPGYGTAWKGEISEGFCVPRGIEIKAHKPVIDSEFVLVPDRPWENRSIGNASLMRDGDRFRCWYRAQWWESEQAKGSGVAYAESSDGIRWDKPGLGLVDFGGAVDNNLCLAGFPYRSVFKDPAAPENERYKMIGCLWTENERKILGAVSPDGLRWSPILEPLMVDQHGDTQTVARYDPKLGKYVMYTRQKDGRMQRRGVNRTTSDDFHHFPASVPVFESDPTDPPDWDIYCNGYAPWPGATDAHLMRLTMYEHTRDTLYVHLATSRDGVIWHRPLGRAAWIDRIHSADMEPYLAIYALDGIVPTATGEWSTYLRVARWGHNEAQRVLDVENRNEDEGILRARTREDGFFSLSSEGRGEFWTIPFELNSDTISLNVRTQYSGFVRCEILAAGLGDTGSATSEIVTIDDFSLEKCSNVSGNHLSADLNWKGNADLGQLKGRTVRLHFDLYKADLYAIRF